MANKVTTELVSATRIGATYYGNPMWMLHTTDGDYRVSNDASISYGVSNFLPRHREPATPVTLTLTRAGRVSNIERREV